MRTVSISEIIIFCFAYFLILFNLAFFFFRAIILIDRILSLFIRHIVVGWEPGSGEEGGKGGVFREYSFYG